ncbi:heparan sulfate 2-O-sulfotransferase pipe-like [Atheta coriaria]|uniref:heparan sulfate 2-O-sulfotransferase pipe-like n=1 Tax=Dalotia coriaria TaxID=877792 RepID=UPI0031F3A4C8
MVFDVLVRRFSFVRTSELIALVAISTTLFLFLHTRDLSTRLREMEVRLQPGDDGVSANQIISGDSAPENHSNNGNKASMKFIQSAGEVSKIYLLIQMKLTAKIYRNLQTKPSKTLLYPVLIFIEILL